MKIERKDSQSCFRYQVTYIHPLHTQVSRIILSMPHICKKSVLAFDTHAALQNWSIYQICLYKMYERKGIVPF